MAIMSNKSDYMPNIFFRTEHYAQPASLQRPHPGERVRIQKERGSQTAGVPSSWTGNPIPIVNVRCINL